MTTEIPVPLSPIKKMAGRPRRLTLDAIVDAACDIGIARLEMGLLAERLNTGVATLYGYVKGREHLLALVTQRLAGQALVPDRGQSWQDIIREHAAVTFAIFEASPELITNLIVGGADLQSASYAQLILDMLIGRGLSPRAAANVYIEANQVVLGAAIFLIRRRALSEAMLDGIGGAAQLPDVLGDYRPTLERIIGGFER
ncbi:hypothetical protein Q4F19_09045 [Sphingomonas sp. BIUV-7]|uniref:TetR family transcriptional regulator n=1 Tax=Sphingomonas natans TaxID=3063330 RepID=A0ABT8YA40_9SPHN|nr:hypothetical protein [Sphingomonas sp. BIUV-7]MDO6414525.1 hypothetical protein [Sphingomonas sp. BIUV-7]